MFKKTEKGLCSNHKIKFNIRRQNLYKLHFVTIKHSLKHIRVTCSTISNASIDSGPLFITTFINTSPI